MWEMGRSCREEAEQVVRAQQVLVEHSHPQQPLLQRAHVHVVEDKGFVPLHRAESTPCDCEQRWHKPAEKTAAWQLNTPSVAWSADKVQESFGGVSTERAPMDRDRC